VNRRWLAAAIGALVLVTGCGGATTGGPPPVELAPRPPVGAQTLSEVPPPPDQDTTCGDATASLRPDGPLPAPGQMPAGSTMERIQTRGRLIVGVDQNTYLFGYRDPLSGELSGFDIDIARKLAQAIFGDPSKIEFRVMTSADRIPKLKSNDVDVVVRTFTINCERRKEIEFSSVYFEAEQRVLVARDSDATGLADLGGQRRVCAAEKSTSIARIANFPGKLVPVQVKNWSDCLVLLQLGQVEAVSTDNTILAGMAEQDPGTKVVGDSIADEPYGIGVPLANKDMVRFVNGVLEGLRSDGTWTEIYQRYLGVLGDPPPPPTPLYQD
jgi:polar amino acid transport system substrate-binding protein